MSHWFLVQGSMIRDEGRAVDAARDEGRAG